MLLMTSAVGGLSLHELAHLEQTTSKRHCSGTGRDAGERKTEIPTTAVCRAPNRQWALAVLLAATASSIQVCKASGLPTGGDQICYSGEYGYWYGFGLESFGYDTGTRCVKKRRLHTLLKSSFWLHEGSISNTLSSTWPGR